MQNQKDIRLNVLFGLLLYPVKTVLKCFIIKFQKSKIKFYNFNTLVSNNFITFAIS
jgi:hypothetical protein